MCTAFQCFLTVVCHLCTIIVKEMILCGGAELVSEVVTHGNHKHRWHIVAGACTILICAEHWRHFTHVEIWHGDIRTQFVGLVLGIYLCAELILGSNGQTVHVEVEADYRTESPCSLVTVELYVQQFHAGLVHVGNDVSAIITVIVRCTQSHRCCEIIGNLVCHADLTAIYVLLSFHLGVYRVFVRGHCAARITIEQSHERGSEHRNSLVVFNESSAAHDAEHSRHSPFAFLISREDAWHERCRSFSLVFMCVVLVDEHRECGCDVAVLVRNLPVERELPSLSCPYHSGRVAVGTVNLEGCSSCHHTVESDVVVGVGHQSSCRCRYCHYCH